MRCSDPQLEDHIDQNRMTHYYRPIPMTDIHRSTEALPLAGGWCWFDKVAVMEKGRKPVVVPANEITEAELGKLTQRRSTILNQTMSAPRIMGILNVTPDSFSDGGDHNAPSAAAARAVQMATDGASFIDIGGESTRPGAEEVPVLEETSRVTGALNAIREASNIPVSVDTRKSEVAAALSDDPSWMINDVSAGLFDTAMFKTAARHDVPICLMHSVGTPETMQSQAVYDDVVLDVYDHLKLRIDAAIAAGVATRNIIVDPGIGFGKTLDHNLALLQNLSLFHGLGCPILLGASRKRFIGTISGEDAPKDRMPGSVAVAQWGVQQGVQILRVHDTKPTKQMINLMMAVITGKHDT